MSTRIVHTILAAAADRLGRPLTTAEAHRILHAAGIPGRRTASRAVRRLHARQTTAGSST